MASLAVLGVVVDNLVVVQVVLHDLAAVYGGFEHRRVTEKDVDLLERQTLGLWDVLRTVSGVWRGSNTTTGM
jgi:hypothetical protein